MIRRMAFVSGYLLAHLGRLTPPDGLRQRICWIFLLSVQWINVHALILLLLGLPADPIQRFIGAAGQIWLGWSYVRAYRTGRYPRPHFVLEAAVVAYITHAIGNVNVTFGLFIVPLFLRGQYASGREMLGATVSLLIARVGVTNIWPSLLGDAPLKAPGEISASIVAIVMVGLMMYVVGMATRRHERAAERERSLARAGAALVAADEPADVLATAFRATRDILVDTDITRLTILLREDDVTRVAGSDGVDADLANGKEFRMQDIPMRFVARGQRRQFVIDANAQSEIAAFQGFAPHVGVVSLIPMVVKQQPVGMLMVESPVALPSESTDAILTLASEVALALDSARLTEDLRRLAFFDPLTRLANRAQFFERTRQAIDRRADHAGSLAVLYLDLDNFKVVNDSLGHAAGDELLVVVAERLRQSVRPTDTVARLGGDEFTVLLEDVADLAEARHVAERIAQQLKAPIALQSRHVTISGSIGIALCGSDESTEPGELLKAADVALYAAKHRGKSQAVVWNPAMSSSALDRLDLEADLRRALERRELEVHYQPLVRLDDGRIAELEALVRWRHPQRGLVSPGEFIGIAEETGLIVSIGEWVLATACAQARAWQAAYPTQLPLIMSVNVSARQLEHPTLVADVQRVLEETGLDPQTLRLEITESIAVADTPANQTTLWGLRDLGVRLAIDDFGTGNSALNYLRRFPFDTLKIDRSFVEDIGADARTTAMVRGMIAFAKSLGLNVTGEGIETPEQSAHLRAMGCDWGQGYLYARPVAADRIDALLADAGGASKAA